MGERVEYARPRVIRGTRIKPLPLLPSGPGGVHSHPLHEARSLTTTHANMRVKLAFNVAFPLVHQDLSGSEAESLRNFRFLLFPLITSPTQHPPADLSSAYPSISMLIPRLPSQCDGSSGLNPG